MNDPAGNGGENRTRTGRASSAAPAATLAQAASPGQRRGLLRRLAPMFFVFALAVVVYLNVLPNDFVSDDAWIISNNASIRDLRNIPSFFAQDYWHGTAHSNLYRPVTISSMALTYAIAGLHPGAYHATNVLLHALCSVLVFLLARRLWPSGLAAVFAGAVFALHPVHTEAVDAAFGRSELLAALGVLSALLLHARDYRWGSLPAWPVRTIAVVAFACGALSKESAFILPALLVLYDVVLARGVRKRIPDYAPFAVAAVILFAARSVVVAGSQEIVAFADNPLVHASFFVRFLTGVAVLGRYLLLLIWPLRLSIDYSFAQWAPIESPSTPAFVAGLFSLAVLAGIVVAAWKRSRPVAFSAAFFFVAIAPTANIVFPIGTIMAERLLYLPSVTAALLAGSGAALLARRGRAARLALAALTILVLGGFAVRTFTRTAEWRTIETLYSSAARVSPRSFRVHSVLGEVAQMKGDLPVARAEFERAVAIWPKWSYTFWRLGSVLRLQGDLAGAGPLFKRAIEIDPKMKDAYFAFAETEQRLHRTESAIQSYEKLERLDPCFADLHQNLGYALREAGQLGEAEKAFRRGIACAPDSGALYRGLAIVLDEQGNTPGAVQAYRDAIARKPGDAVAANNLAWLLSQKGRPPDEALALAERALKLDPSATVYDTIAWIRFRRGDLEGAREAAAEAVRRDSASAEIRERWKTIDAAWKAGNRHGGNP